MTATQERPDELWMSRDRLVDFLLALAQYILTVGTVLEQSSAYTTTVQHSIEFAVVDEFARLQSNIHGPKCLPSGGRIFRRFRAGRASNFGAEFTSSEKSLRDQDLSLQTGTVIRIQLTSLHGLI